MRIPGEISDAHKSLVCTTARPVGIPKRRWEDIIKVGFKQRTVKGEGTKYMAKEQDQYWVQDFTKVGKYLDYRVINGFPR